MTNKEQDPRKGPHATLPNAGSLQDYFFSQPVTPQQRRLRAAIEDGLAHGSRIEPADPQPGEAVTLHFSTNATYSIDEVAVYYTTDGSTPVGEGGVAARGLVVRAEAGGPGTIITHDKDGKVLPQPVRSWQAVLPAQPDGTLVRYRADGWSESEPGRHWWADCADPITLAPGDGRVFAYHVDRWSTPQWWQDAIVYEIFVDRFATAHDEPALAAHNERRITDFFGGTLRGILEKMDYIEQLGVNCIWLTPVFESPVYHGYNPSDFHRVSSRYGSNEILQELIGEAHRRGMRVLLDFVANHTSDEHPAFIAARNDPQSATASWYAFGDYPPHGYRSYMQIKDQPELLTDNADVQKYLFDAVRYWFEEFGADGLRLDYVPGPTHAFWVLHQQSVKERFPQAFTIGEITTPVQEIAQYAGRLDSYMDFPLSYMLRSVFATHEIALVELLNFLDQRRDSLPPNMSRATVLDNHDMHRFLWLARGQVERLQLAALCQMTLEDTPIIYYGTEIGLSQYEDAHKENGYARPPMLWGEEQNQGLLQYYRSLIALRKNEAVLRYGSLQQLAIEVVGGSKEEQQEVGAYVRSWNGEQILVVLNNNPYSVQVRITLSPREHDQAEPHQNTELHDLLEGQTLIGEENTLELELVGIRGKMLKFGKVENKTVDKPTVSSYTL
jgi:cyclomaltodextrinase